MESTSHGAETAASLDRSAETAFRATLTGAMLRPGDPGYDDARHVWNALVDRHPAMIARCAGAGDVQRAVNFAQQHGLDLSIKGGGHGVAGKAVADGGLMLDLSLLADIRVDPARRSARAGGGAIWGDFDRATQAHGLASTGGIVPTTGVGGLTLGGGLGFLMRRFGLACDNLIAAEVVTAGGEILTASEEEHPDLFWALRGGGGNFGVVTALEFRLHEVGPTVLGGFVFHPMAHAMDLARFYRELTAEAPDELTVHLGFATSPDGDPVAALIVGYTGPIEEGEAVLQPLRSFGSPLADTIAPMSYVDLQAQFAPLYPPGRLNYWKSSFLADLDDAAIETIVEQYARVPSPLTAIAIEHLGGAVARIDGAATAFGDRSAPFSAVITSAWANPAETQSNIDWTRETWDVLRPHAKETVYINYLGDEPERVRDAYGAASYDRLAAVKAQYDPGNLFHLNQNIRPAM